MKHLYLTLLALASASLAQAHVVLPPGPAEAGKPYDAAFRVGHACKGARSTTGITVRLPAGFALDSVPERAGWKIDVARGEPTTVRWTASDAASALPADKSTEFVLRGRPQAPGALRFAVLQTCDSGIADWSEPPVAEGGAKSEFPAATLQVVAAGQAPVQVDQGWARATVPGQSGTGAFMALAAGRGLRLVGASTPAAGVAEVHEMKMQGDTMRMAPVAGGLALPAHQKVELKPGGYHLMLMDLKQPLRAGSRLPLTLRFQDDAGAETTLALELPVQMAPAGDAGAGGHRH